MVIISFQAKVTGQCLIRQARTFHKTLVSGMNEQQLKKVETDLEITSGEAIRRLSFVLLWNIKIESEHDT
jgi:hypothetical protein